MSRHVRSHSPRELIVTAIIVSVAVLFTFGHTINYPFLLWDELGLVLQNPHVTLTLDSIRHVFTSYDPELYIPFTMLSYQLNHAVAEFDPWIYHATNLMLHVLNATLTYVLASFVSGRKTTGLLTAVLFAIHPLHTEAVIWIAGRKDLLMTFFTLSSLCSYIAYEKRGSKVMYAISILAALCAVLSKVTAIVIPLLLMLLISKKRATALVPFVLISAAGIAVGLGGKTAILAQTDWVQKALIAMAHTVFAGVRTFVPVRLSPIHPLDEWVAIDEPLFAIAMVTFIALLALLPQLRKHKVVFVGIVFFLIAFLPNTLNHVREGQLLLPYDRYAYLASVGPLVIAAAALTHLRGIAKALIITAVLIGFVFQSRSYSSLWQDTEALFTHATVLYPDNAFAYDKVAAAALMNGHDRQALNASVTANVLQPNDVHYLTNLGVIYGANGMTRKEIETYEYVKRLKPRYLPARYNLAKAYASVGELTGALREIETVIGLNPDYRDAAELKSRLESAARKYDAR